MKIVLCCRVYSTHGRTGGMIHVVTERAEALVRAGHEVHVLTTSRGNHRLPNVIGENGVDILHAPDGVSQEYRDSYAQFCEIMCASLRPDIIHLDSYDKNRLWWHPFVKRCSVAVTNHGEAIGSQLTDWRLNMQGRRPHVGIDRSWGFDISEWWQEREALKPADAVITTCRFDRWMLSDLLGLGAKVKLVYNPLAPWHFENCVEPLRSTIRSPLTGGSVDLGKKFVICGLWGKEERGFDLARAACKEAEAELLEPNCSRRELRDFYDRSHALLLPTFQSKGYDLSVAEAVARRRPVVMSDCGIAGYEAVDRPWIVTVPPGDLSALVAAVRGPLPEVPANAADEHRPEKHVENWLKAVGV